MDVSVTLTTCSNFFNTLAADGDDDDEANVKVSGRSHLEEDTVTVSRHSTDPKSPGAIQLFVCFFLFYPRLESYSLDPNGIGRNFPLAHSFNSFRDNQSDKSPGAFQSPKNG